MSRDWLAFGALVLVCACAAETSEAPPEDSAPSSSGQGAGGKTSGKGGSTSLSGKTSTNPDDTPSDGGMPGGEDGGTSTGGTSSSGGKTSGTAGKTSGSSGSSNGGSTSGSTNGWKFPTNSESWAASYAEPGALSGSSQVTWDSGTGSPESGSLKLSIPFSGGDQKLDVSVTVAAMNMSGKTITAKVKLDSGLSTSADNPGGAKLYVKTGDAFIYADGGWTNLDNNWATLTLNVTSPAGYNANPGSYKPGDVREIGVEIATGSTGSYTNAVVHIDTVVY